jgi:hypothetical protein
LLDLIAEFFDYTFFFFDNVDKVFYDIFVLTDFTGISLASEMLHFKFEVIDKLGLFG